MQRQKRVLIIGAGPAGLTAAYELLEASTDFIPILFESSSSHGGISRTETYKGNKMDIGGHRFFSKSDVIMAWWQKILPIQDFKNNESGVTIKYQNKNKNISARADAPDPEHEDAVMLIRKRSSKIYFLNTFFDYPISLSVDTLQKLGFVRVVKIGVSYVHAVFFPRKEKNLEDFFINRFGNELYRTFFRDYTEKVWGVPCTSLSPDWGAQRIKGLSISKSIISAIKKIFFKTKYINQKTTETSLIEYFMYPKYGPGQMWDEVAKAVVEKGGVINMNHSVLGVSAEDKIITGITVKNNHTGTTEFVPGDYVISTMPIRELAAGFDGVMPQEVREIAQGLMYRDFITVGLLLKKLIIDPTPTWIYIQERNVKIGRLQIFNNWSPYLVKDKDTMWIGLEYFSNEGDELWKKSDKEFIAFAIDELVSINIINKNDVLDHTIIRQKKAYPAYTGTYDRFGTLRAFFDSIPNLFLIGRNGMHRYNNQDHSMLTAMAAAQAIISGTTSKEALWNVNSEDEYHESK
jgi:protoporphyrinogen oxidase